MSSLFGRKLSHSKQIWCKFLKRLLKSLIKNTKYIYNSVKMVLPNILMSICIHPYACVHSFPINVKVIFFGAGNEEAFTTFLPTNKASNKANGSIWFDVKLTQNTSSVCKFYLNNIRMYGRMRPALRFQQHPKVR